jgi:glutathione S-transferase
VDTHARFIESHLSRQRWFAGAELSMADIQMSFPAMALLARGGVEIYPSDAVGSARGAAPGLAKSD